MTTQDLIDQAELKPLSRFAHRDVEGVFISDMVSDVMALAQPGNLWLTIQTHKSIIPAANLVDVAAIVITGGKEVPAETIDLASKYDVAILSTSRSTFEMAGQLYKLGLGGEQTK
ncbi:MAG TPA: DRTGG domain-containing protein [Hyphomicrobiaceae bacterium]|nr:DRTGG domain-containing protein [Hyphomicrobiaceae bacterium]HUU45078.1 DRTGG domain-containing protein [Acidobacteriota bacterium]